MTPGFSVKFVIDRVTPSYKIQITDTTDYTGVLTAYGFYRIEYPDGIYTENSDILNPDFEIGQNFSEFNLRLINFQLMTGQFRIIQKTFTDVDDVETTKVFTFSFIEPILTLLNTSNLATPSVSFTDVTNYNSGFYTEVITKSIVSNFPATSPIPATQLSTSTSVLTMVSSGNYYEGIYLPALTSSVILTGTNHIIEWSKSASFTFDIRKLLEYTTILEYLNIAKARYDQAKGTTNESKERENYQLVASLIEHIQTKAIHGEQGIDALMFEIQDLIYKITCTFNDQYVYSTAPLIPIDQDFFTEGVPLNRVLTINGVAQDLTQDRVWNVGTVTSVDILVPSWMTVSGGPITQSGTFNLGLATGYYIPTTEDAAKWDDDTFVTTINVTGTTTKTITLTRNDGVLLTATFNDIDTFPVTSVNSKTGDVVLVTDDIQEDASPANLWFTQVRARTSISLTTTGYSGASTYDQNTGVFNIPNYTLAGLGGVPLTRTITINEQTFDLSQDRVFTVNIGVSSVSAISPILVSGSTGSVTISHSNSGVTPGTYNSFTVDSKGHVTNASNQFTGHVIQDDSVNMPQRTNLNFIRMIVEDDLVNNATKVTRPPSVTVSTTPPTEDLLEGDEWINDNTWKKYAWYDGYWVEVGKTDCSTAFFNASAPVNGSYASQALLFADQPNQTANYIYFDGGSYWEYLGTTNGNITDYRELGGGDPEFYESITFTQLQSLISTNGLMPGKSYMVSDFQTIHRILGTSAINAGPVEPLISIAVATNRLSSSVKSTTYPRDVITIDWANILCEDGTTPRKGWIVDRYDPISNIHIQGYDWRTVKFRRYRIVRKRKDEITAIGANALDLFISIGGSLGASLGATFLLNAYTAAGLTHSAGAIIITIRNGSFTYTRPLIKFDNSTTFTANELANRNGQITYCPNRNAFVYMYMNNNGFGENIVGFTLAPYSSAIWAPGNGISYDVDNTIFADFTTLGDIQSSSSVRIGMSPNTANSNMTNNVFYFGANDLTMGTNCYNNTSIYGILSMTTGNQFYENYMIAGMAWCQFNEEVFNCYFNTSNGTFSGGIQDVLFHNTVYDSSFYLSTYGSIELTAGKYNQFYLEGNMFTFVGGIYENSRVYLGGVGGGEGRTHFVSRMPSRDCTIGYFSGTNFTINQRLLGVYYYQRPISNNIFDSIALRSIPSGTPVSSLGVTADGDVVTSGGVTLAAVSNNGNTSPVVLKHPDGVAPEDSATVGQLTILQNTLEESVNLRTFGITIDGAGNPIATGIKGYTIIPYDCEILAWYIIADTVGSIEIDVWKAASIPTGASSICGADRPKLVSVQENQNETLSAWSISVISGDVVAFNVVSASIVTKVNLVIKTKVII